MEATIQYIRKELDGFYPENEIKAFERIILEKVCGMDYTQQILMRKQKLDDRFFQPVSEMVGRLKNYEPIQYIVGRTEFYGLSLRVTPAVLIPRPETEELVQWITESDLPRTGRILDVGTGSGCIALALKKQLPLALVSALDLSEDALKIARQNAEINKLNVHFFQADILHPKNTCRETYTVIVSNPPYVRESEKAVMSPNVLNHEPHSALFVSDTNPLLFYRKIATLARTFLEENGHLFFEINENLGHEVAELLSDNKFRNIEVKKDLSGKTRMVRCKK